MAWWSLNRGDDSGADAAETARPPWRPNLSVARFGPYLILGLYLFALLYMIRLFNNHLDLGDEGMAIMNGWRIAEGQIPHRDFFEIIPPFSFLPTALMFKLLGVGVVAERLLVLFYGMALLAAAERLTARLTANLWARAMVMAYLIPFGVFYLPMLNHHWVADILQVSALLALERGLAGGRVRGWGALAGVLCALSAFSLQDQGGIFIVALAGLFFPWIPDRDLRKKLFLGWAAGGAAVAAAFAAYLLPHVSLSDLWYQWFAFPLGHYKKMPGNNLAILGAGKPLQSMLQGPLLQQDPVYMSSYVFGQLVALLLPLFAALSLAALWIRREAPRFKLLLIAAGGFAFALTALRRFSIVNAIWAAPLLLVLFAWLLASIWDHGRAWARWSARTVCLLIMAASLFYSGVVLLSFNPRRMANVQTPAGTILHGDLEIATYFQQAIDQIEARVPVGEPMFCRNVASLSAFSLRMNPTRYNWIIAGGYHTPEQAAEWIDSLERSRTRWGVSTNYTPDPADPVDRYLAEKWVPAWANAGFILWTRRPS